ncbi:unnamed protein product [Paramecium sonneborni]|uniref:Uncharacterized protein n=1 Tax=Paramecium sonneborni TaxID=65129 RepID=A0A8S1M8I1_9CILI|nr:unnamed protein product [Paramecium sonneborni]
MSQSNSSNHSESEDEDQKKDQLGEEIIDDQNEMESKIKNTANVANLDRDKKKQHFYTINPDEDFKMVKLKSYPVSSQLEKIFGQYKRIQSLKPSEEEIFLKLEDQQFQKERQLTIKDLKTLRKERNHKFFNYLIEVRKNFVNEELFSKFRKKVKVFSFDENAANKEKQDQKSGSETGEKESDVFSNYSEFY